MDVTRSANALRRISSGLRVAAWVVFAVFAVMAVQMAFKVAFIPMESASVEQYLPTVGGMTALSILVVGIINLLVMLGLAEVFQLVIAIEQNTRAAAGAAAPAPEKVAAGER